MSREEDGAASSKVVIHRVGQPAADEPSFLFLSIWSPFRISPFHLQPNKGKRRRKKPTKRKYNSRAPDIRRGVNQPHQVNIPLTVSSYPQRLRKRQIRPVTSRLVPPLHGGTDGTGDDSHVQRPRNTPFVEDFILQDLDFFGLELVLA